MSGQAAISGFLVQDLACIIDATDSTDERFAGQGDLLEVQHFDYRNWQKLQFEPINSDTKHDFIDIIWTMRDGSILIQQIKHSLNKPRPKELDQIVDLLVSSRNFAGKHHSVRYEILFFGPHRGENYKHHSGAIIRFGQTNKIEELIARCAHKIDRYIERVAEKRELRVARNMPAILREALVHSLVASLLTRGANTCADEHVIESQKFDDALLEFIVAALPGAIQAAWSPACISSISSLFILPGRMRYSACSYNFAICFRLVNPAPNMITVEWILMRTRQRSETEWRYFQPIHEVTIHDLLRRYVNSTIDIINHWGGLIVPAYSDKDFALIFVENGKGRDIDIDSDKQIDKLATSWPDGLYDVEIFIKFLDLSEPQKVLSAEFENTRSMRNSFTSGSGQHLTLGIGSVTSIESQILACQML